MHGFLAEPIFFTVNLLERHNNDLLIRHIDHFKDVLHSVKNRHHFNIHAWVVLPDHMHCVIELAEGDFDYATQWRLIKMDFSKGIPKNEKRSNVRIRRGERGIWQRRYWEYVIRDEKDYRAHVDYVHINPLKHGLVKCVKDWPYSTFHRMVKEGFYSYDWEGAKKRA